MKTSRILIPILGLLFLIGGVIFVLQGFGIVGPPDSFMFNSGQWIYNGVVVLVIGAVVVVLGLRLMSSRGR